MAKVLLSSGKCFSFVGFDERRNHSRSRTSHLCPNGLLTNVVVKRALAAAQCVFINDDRTQSMPTQSGVDIEAISSSTCIISTAPVADVLAPSLIRSVIWCFIGTIRLPLRSPFQPYTISVFGFLTRIGRHDIFLIILFILTPYYILCHYFTRMFYIQSIDFDES